MKNIESIIYLDNNSTTPLDERVLEAMLPYFRNNYANANSTHLFGLTIHEAVENASEQLADLIAAKADNIIFTSGATEAINLAIKGLTLSERKHIVIVSTEHKAVLDTCAYMEKQGYSITYLPVDKNGLVDINRLAEVVNEKTLLVSLMLVNNETGVMHSIKRISEIAHAKGVLLLCDATQAVGKIAINVRELGIDFLPVSAHKFYGPKGIGALYISSMAKKDLSAQIHGGGQQMGLRSGTLNVPGIIGMGKAASIAQQEMAEESIHIGKRRNELENGLLSIPDVFRNGHPEQRLYNTTNLCFPGVNSEQMIMALQYISVSNGSACTAATTQASHVLKAMGLSDLNALSSIRFSLGRFTTSAEIEQTIDKVRTVVSRLRA